MLLGHRLGLDRLRLLVACRAGASLLAILGAAIVLAFQGIHVPLTLAQLARRRLVEAAIEVLAPLGGLTLRALEGAVQVGLTEIGAEHGVVVERGLVAGELRVVVQVVLVLAVRVLHVLIVRLVGLVDALRDIRPHRLVLFPAGGRLAVRAATRRDRGV